MSRSGEDKRQAIMEAALDLFVELGFHGAPTSLIAKRAGVGVGTIYRYFQSKEELIHRIYDDL
ncbi:TetR/AcrR family transcriptional regulator, partial [bacterium]|nr:TetR/AcrR family transcriptional regulator [bacterium]